MLAVAHASKCFLQLFALRDLFQSGNVTQLGLSISYVLVGSGVRKHVGITPCHILSVDGTKRFQ